MWNHGALGPLRRAPRSGAPNATGDRMMSPLRVLHVDDCDDVRTVVGLTLSGVGGMKVTQSASGPEAIASIAGTEADILLLDVMMPEISGPELLCYLRSIEKFRDTPAVFLTAKASPEEVETLMT